MNTTSDHTLLQLWSGATTVVHEDWLPIFAAAAGARPGFKPMTLFTHMLAFPPGDYKEVIRPNFDTLYSIVWLGLTEGPWHWRSGVPPMFTMIGLNKAEGEV